MMDASAVAPLASEATAVMVWIVESEVGASAAVMATPEPRKPSTSENHSTLTASPSASAISDAMLTSAENQLVSELKLAL